MIEFITIVGILIAILGVVSLIAVVITLIGWACMAGNAWVFDRLDQRAMEQDAS